MSVLMSWRKRASWGDLPARVLHMLAGTWAKSAGASWPRISVDSSLSSVVPHAMGRQFPHCAQSPFLEKGWTMLAYSGRMGVAP